MFKEMTPGKKKLIYIAIAVVIVLVIVFFIWRSRKKKKNEKEAAEKISGTQPTELKTPTAPKMQIVPDEDNYRGKQQTEAPMSVAQVIPEKKTEVAREAAAPTGAPGTLGVPGNGAKKQASAPAPTKSSLPPEFMMDANNPSANV